MYIVSAPDPDVHCICCGGLLAAGRAERESISRTAPQRRTRAPGARPGRRRRDPSPAECRVSIPNPTLFFSFYDKIIK